MNQYTLLLEALAAVNKTALKFETLHSIAEVDLDAEGIANTRAVLADLQPARESLLKFLSQIS